MFSSRWGLCAAEVGSGRGKLWFFPVDNRKGKDDPVLVEVMRAVEKVIEEEEYVKRKVPLHWISLFDQLRQDKRAAITMAELERLARKHSFKGRSAPFVKVLAGLSLADTDASSDAGRRAATRRFAKILGTSASFSQASASSCTTETLRSRTSSSSTPSTFSSALAA